MSNFTDFIGGTGVGSEISILNAITDNNFAPYMYHFLEHDKSMMKLAEFPEFWYQLTQQPTTAAMFFSQSQARITDIVSKYLGITVDNTYANVMDLANDFRIVLRTANIEFSSYTGWSNLIDDTNVVTSIFKNVNSCAFFVKSDVGLKAFCSSTNITDISYENLQNSASTIKDTLDSSNLFSYSATTFSRTDTNTLVSDAIDTNTIVLPYLSGNQYDGSNIANAQRTIYSGVDSSQVLWSYGGDGNSSVGISNVVSIRGIYYKTTYGSSTSTDPKVSCHVYTVK